MVRYMIDKKAEDMAYNSNKNLKLYYSIGEVAEMFNVSETLLRYWEKEFPNFITPAKAEDKSDSIPKTI